MATQDLQKDKNELLEFVKNCDLNEQEKEQMYKDVLEIFEWEEELDENLLILKDNVDDLKSFQTQVEVMLISLRYQKESRAIQSRMERMQKEFEALQNPSKEEKAQFEKALKDDEALIQKLANEYLAKFDKNTGEKKKSFKEKLVGAFKWGKCKVGIHAGEYQQKEGMPKCYWWKICPDCNELVEKSEHQYGYWDRKDSHNPCRVRRECEYCGHKESKIEHAFDAPIMDYCQIYEVCMYCGYRQHKGTSHEWRYMEGGRKICTRCGEQGYTS